MAAENTARRWWASIGAGVLLCLGCCLAPLLIAAGVLGSGTLLVGMSWLEPVGIALIGVGVAGLIWSQRRVRRRNCGSGSSSGSCADSGCGCTAVAATAA